MHSTIPKTTKGTLGRLADVVAVVVVDSAAEGIAAAAADLVRQQRD